MLTTGELLEAVIEAKPGGLPRSGQQRMADAVASAVSDGCHLLVEAGPGTGKSFGYLVPLIGAGVRAVVSTATKSLQDQLTERDLPFLSSALEPLGVSFTWAQVKGRANYLCMARLAEVADRRQAALFEDGVDDLETIVEWVAAAPSGDRDDLPAPVADDVWDELSVSGMECPGREACPQGSTCFAMAALDRAATADIVVVNHHLYAAHLMANHAMLGDHDVVVFDEGHRLADTMANAFGLELGPARLYQLRRAARFLGTTTEGKQALERLGRDARRLAAALDEQPLGRIRTVAATPIGSVCESIISDADELMRQARRVADDGPQAGARARLLRLTGHMLGDLGVVSDPPDGHVLWTERSAAGPVLRLASTDIGDRMTDDVLDRATVIVTSATLSVGRRVRATARALGLRYQVAVDGFADTAEAAPEADDEGAVRSYRALHVDSPFDFGEQARFYVATDLPPPGSGPWTSEACRRVAALVDASGGRALILTTSHRMVGAISEHLRDTVPVTVLAQGDLPKRRLIEAFEQDETSVLVATLGYWEGIDVPGRSLQLVVLDKVPFPRPDDPLWQARRERAEADGLNAFSAVDLPRAAVLLAQGAGRLIRSVEDRGVVALLDSRMATKQYGRTLVASMPDMPGTTSLEEVTDFLRRL